MKIVGLTGSIGMGKTTTSSMFKDLGVHVWDADSAVHRLYGPAGKGGVALSPIFPDVVRDDGSVDRDVLSQHVIGNSSALKQLETIIHPLVGQDRADFLYQVRQDGAAMVLLDVPLLFETGGNTWVDQVIVVSCGHALQRARVLARPGMTEEKFASILSRQTPDADKRAQADFVITTDDGLDHTRKQVLDVYNQILATSAMPSGKS
jgi:dephospho-CoA kinase